MTKGRELEVVREIAHVFLTSTTAVEGYRRALSRLTPMVGAAFSSVFLRDAAEPDLLKLACAQSWPQSSARFLGQLRIRVGRGPTGRAVSERRAVEVPDVFADPALREWWEPARELGFASLISLPLATGEDAVGAVTFYFAAAHHFDAAERELLGMVADQLGAAAAGTRPADLLEPSRVKPGQAPVERRSEDAVALARRALESAGPVPDAIELGFQTPAAQVPVTTDGEKVITILTNLLSNAFRFTGSGRVDLEIDGTGDRVSWTVRDTGIGIRREDHDAIFDEFRQVEGTSTRLCGGTGLGLALSRRLAHLLDGQLELESEPGAGSAFTLSVPRTGG